MKICCGQRCGAPPSAAAPPRGEVGADGQCHIYIYICTHNNYILCLYIYIYTYIYICHIIYIYVYVYIYIYLMFINILRYPIHVTIE